MARYINKSEKKPSAIIWVLGVAIVVIGVISAVFLLHKGIPQNRNADTTVVTPYCTLYYPEKWTNQVHIEIVESPVYRVSYSALFSRGRSVALFDISFNDDAANSVGTIQTLEGELITVGIFIPESGNELSAEELNIVQDMKDDLNNILENIPFVTVSEKNEHAQVLETEIINYQDIAIETPYCQLTYPGRWQDYLQVTHVQEDSYQLSFAAVIEGKPALPLFDIVFSGRADLGVIDCDGKLIGVSLVIHEFTPDANWTAEQINIVSAMQEAINEIIVQLDLQETAETDTLEESAQSQTTFGDAPNMVASQETVPEKTNPVEMIIETPYGQLKYPGKWMSNITIEITDNNGYIVVFYGTVGIHERIHLFSVCFGDAAEVAIDTVLDSSGNEVSFGIVPSSFQPGTDWSTEESNTLYEMMEDVNYLIYAFIVE